MKSVFQLQNELLLGMRIAKGGPGSGKPAGYGGGSKVSAGKAKAQAKAQAKAPTPTKAVSKPSAKRSPQGKKFESRIDKTADKLYKLSEKVEKLSKTPAGRALLRLTMKQSMKELETYAKQDLSQFSAGDRKTLAEYAWRSEQSARDVSMAVSDVFYDDEVDGGGKLYEEFDYLGETLSMAGQDLEETLKEAYYEDEEKQGKQ